MKKRLSTLVFASIFLCSGVAEAKTVSIPGYIPGSEGTFRTESDLIHFIVTQDSKYITGPSIGFGDNHKVLVTEMIPPAAWKPIALGMIPQAVKKTGMPANSLRMQIDNGRYLLHIKTSQGYGWVNAGVLSDCYGDVALGLPRGSGGGHCP